MSILLLYIIFITVLLTSNNLFIYLFFQVYTLYPNASIVYIIQLIIPVTVASTKKSFSKLKLLNLTCDQLCHKKD